MFLAPNSPVNRSQHSDCMPRPSLQAHVYCASPVCTGLLLRRSLCGPVFWDFTYFCYDYYVCEGVRENPAYCYGSSHCPTFIPSLTLRNFTQLNLTWLLCLSPYYVVGCDFWPVYPLRNLTVLNWQCGGQCWNKPDLFFWPFFLSLVMSGCMRLGYGSHSRISPIVAKRCR